MDSTEAFMFIPSYQIHNILKDFTQQLKKIRQETAPQAGSEAASPGPTRTPNALRLAPVVSKVADRIMNRIADLGQEAVPATPSESERPPHKPGAESKIHPAVFDFYRLDREKGKVKQRLVVEDSQNLVRRFERVTAAGASGPENEP